MTLSNCAFLFEPCIREDVVIRTSKVFSFCAIYVLISLTSFAVSSIKMSFGNSSPASAVWKGSCMLSLSLCVEVDVVLRVVVNALLFGWVQSGFWHSCFED